MSYKLSMIIYRLRTWWQQRRSGWLTQRPSVALDAPAPGLEFKRCVTVVIPALNEAARIAEVVRHALSDEATAEVIVVDDSSTDATATLAREAGAQVLTSSMLGKGASMRDALEFARHPYVVYLDGDLTGLKEGIVSDLARPLIQGQGDFVKARFGRGGGRVTELTAKPMLKVFFPELAHLSQPLGGIIAVQRNLLLQLSFEDGYGVDVGLLIDAVLRGARIVEVDIGRIEHDSQPLRDLAAMANEVARVIFARSRAAGRLHVEQISAMYEAQRHATASVEYILGRRREQRKLLLLDMDGTLTPARFVLEMARVSGLESSLAPLLDRPMDDAATRSARIAALFRFIHRQQFENLARSLPLRPGIVEWVNAMRRAGFMVGVVSDSYFVAAEILRRRIFADFALAHTLNFSNEVCSGELKLNTAFTPLDPGATSSLCKSHALQRLQTDDGRSEGPNFEEVWVVGDHINDLALLRAADRAFIVEPKSSALRSIPGVHEFKDFIELSRVVKENGWLDETTLAEVD